MILPPKTASAIRIKNLSDQAHQVAIGTYGDRVEVIEIEPNGTYHTLAPHVRLRLLTGKTSMQGTIKGRFRDEFAIWPNGDFGIQRRRPPQNPRR